MMHCLVLGLTEVIVMAGKREVMGVFSASESSLLLGMCSVRAGAFGTAPSRGDLNGECRPVPLLRLSAMGASNDLHEKDARPMKKTILPRFQTVESPV
jgi:hypothetical protein